MPWKQVKPMDEKIRFMSDYLNGVFTFTELCERYDISRKTGYKWVDRYVEEGAAGLEDRPRTPHTSRTKCPQRWKTRWWTFVKSIRPGDRTRFW